MIDTIKNICTALVFGFILACITYLLDSKYLGLFFDENLVMILIALLAINTTTMSIIMTKLKEISEKNNAKFAESIKAMKISIYEQIVLIILAVILLIVKSSTILSTVSAKYNFVVLVLLSAIFVYAICVLFDTAKGIFVIISFEKDGYDKDVTA